MARDLLPKVRDAVKGRYEVEREVGRGGAARVFAARNAAGEPVALKVLHPQLLVTVTADRFLREIALVSRLHHPNIAPLLDYGEQDWLVYYVMPYLEGPTLRQQLDRARRTSITDAVRIAGDLLAALDHAHQAGIVHRDVKPDNILLTRAGTVLVDFGIARAIAMAGTDRLTRSGFAVGTSAYMSPEQVAGEDDVDHRSDLYSLACVLFECLAGTPPFVDPLEVYVLRMHQTVEAPEVRTRRPDTPEPLATAIARALRKNRDERWISAERMMEAIGSKGGAVPQS